MAAAVRLKGDVVKVQSLVPCLKLLVFAVLVCGCNKAEKQPVKAVAQSAVAAPEAPVAQQESAEVGDPIIVTVNQESLTRSAADDMVRDIAARQGVPPQMMDSFLQQAGDQLTQQAVSQFIDQTLAQAEIKRRDITVSDADVSNVVERITASLPDGMTIEEALGSRGITMAGLLSDIAESERIRKLMDAVTDGMAPVTDEQVVAFYGENDQYFKKDAGIQASHILIGCKEDADAEEHAKASAEAEAVRQQLEEGADFAELAKQKSSCPSKERGGDLGSFGRGQMVPEFDEAAFSQEVGVIGPVVKTSFGYHIIKVTDQTEATTQPLEEVTDQIRQHLTDQARQEKAAAFLRGLRDTADITYAQGVPQAD